MALGLRLLLVMKFGSQYISNRQLGQTADMAKITDGPVDLKVL